MNTIDLAAAVRALDSPWLDERTGAAYFHVSVKQFERVSKRPGFPRLHRNGKWHKGELDAWMDGVPHGHVSAHPLYNTWKKMHDRCGNPKAAQYRWYGARGVTVCDRWREFPTFLFDMGERPTPTHSLDRIDNDKGYQPGNCRWATRAEQYANRRQPVPLGSIIAIEALG
jgi:hypothetical protein